jgi:type I restriction enzyme M protein
MAYESDSFKEHHLTRLPVLQSLIEMGWNRAQIICPSPDSDETEWRIPKTPSEAAKREAKHRFKGYPADIALFDDADYVGDYEHVIALIECKEPSMEHGISQLKIYLGLEPHARLGIWTNGTEFVRVYKLPTAGSFKVVAGTALPKPDENIILADEQRITYADLHIPSVKELKNAFLSLLGSITSRDTKSTRREDQLSQISNVLLVKLDSDRAGQWDQSYPLAFQLNDTPERTREVINRFFKAFKIEHPSLFAEEEPDEIVFDEDTIQEIVLRLQFMNIGAMAPDALSIAFQVFRDATLKLGDGQYYTPIRVIEAGVAMMDISHRDSIIDPACGTGGFLSAALMKVSEAGADSKAVSQWAHYKLFGVDRDKTNIKLTRALMVGIGDGSTNARHGDSLRESKWTGEASELKSILGTERYTAVLTNPPFGQNLVISAADAKASKLEICKHSPSGLPAQDYAPTTELGIAFVERAWHMLQNGGRLGIVLPETYFFSKSYSWFREWMDKHFILRGALNIAMEAFQGFCRAKTNFYVFEKRGNGPKVPTPSWFRDGYVWVSCAPTIGLNKDGLDLFVVNDEGQRTSEIDDVAMEDVRALLAGKNTPTSGYVPLEPMATSFIAVPTFSGNQAESVLKSKVALKLEGFTTKSLGDLMDEGIISIRGGHGSPSADVRKGNIPYIKVVDLRAGKVNPNRTNMVSIEVARRFWKGNDSGVTPWTIVTPARASKNIGEPCMIMPGQEQSVFTKEVLMISVSPDAPIDPFFLFWALGLDDVKKQWGRVVFMQTNREDLGNRYRLIEIPYTDDEKLAQSVSSPYKKYFTTLAAIQKELNETIISL